MKKMTTLAALIGSLAVVPAAQALDLAPPSGAIIDLAAIQTTVTQPYTQYSTTFVAGQSLTYISFLFRRDPSFFGFDDASLTLGSTGVNLLADPGFEDSPVDTQNPPGWGNFQQTGGINATGIVNDGAGRGSTGAHSGANFWDDGSVGAYDGIYQQVALAVGQSYTLSFWLANPNGTSVYSQSGPDGQGIDVLAYAGAELPDGTVVTAPAPPAPPPAGPPATNGVPEPDVAALLALGALGFTATRRKGRKSA